MPEMPLPPEPEPVRIPDDDLDDLVGALTRAMAAVRDHGVPSDRLRAEPILGSEDSEYAADMARLAS